MAKAYSNIGNAMIAHYRERQAAEAANQQLMASLFAPMKFKQIEADKERVARKEEAEYRYSEEAKSREALKKINMEQEQFKQDRADAREEFKANADYLKELMKQAAETERAKIQDEQGKDRLTQSELMRFGNELSEAGELQKSEIQDQELIGQIQYFMDLPESEKKKIGDDVPILGQLKSVWEGREGGDWYESYDRAQGKDRLGFSDYAAVLGITPERMAKVRLAEEKQKTANDLSAKLQGITGLPEEQGAEIISSLFDAVRNFNEQQLPIPSTGDAPRSESVEDAMLRMTYRDFYNNTEIPDNQNINDEDLWNAYSGGE